MQLKYLQLNVWLGGKLWDTMVDFLKREDADIVALQEVYDGHDTTLEKRFRTLDILKQELGYPYHAFAPAIIDTRDNLNLPWGNAILSKFPITKHEAIFFDVPFGERKTGMETAEYAPRNMVRATIDAPDTLLNVYSIHGIWGHDGNDNSRRLAMSGTIIKRIKGIPHAIISGDFNVQEKTKTIGNLEKHLRNVFKGERATSFNMRIKTDQKFANAVVDHLFVSSDLTVIDHYQPDVDASDHLPMVCTLKL